MKPRQKAKDLFNKYFEYVEAFSSDQQKENAIKCASICVDELLNSAYDTYKLTYFREVKNELEKL